MVQRKKITIKNPHSVERIEGKVSKKVNGLKIFSNVLLLFPETNFYSKPFFPPIILSPQAGLERLNRMEEGQFLITAAH